MEIFSIGFTQTTAEHFFRRLGDNAIERLVDVRLNTTSQLAGFAKERDLPYFLNELVGVEYEHEPLLAPTADILTDFKRDKRMPWSEYERRFLTLLRERRVEERLERSAFERRTVLLCSEATPDRCHRRLVIDYLSDHWTGITAKHL